MNTVTICDDVYDSATWQTFVDVEDVREFCTKYYSSWPVTAKIFLNSVSQSNDITPYDEASVARLAQLEGHFYIVVFPEGIETIFIIIAIAVAAVAVGLSFLLRPHTTPNAPNQQDQSPNNELSDRQNTDRPNERIPDIFGKLWSTPDLIAQPYKIFDGTGTEIEYAYYCIGRGSYTIDQVRDDLTPMSQIQGSSVEVYGPFTSPNFGTPSLRIGAAIGEPVRAIKPSTAINGQTLIAPNLTGGGVFTGPFVVGDANTTDIWFNFTAQSGAYQVPSSTGVQASVTVTIQVGVTPVDASGTPTAAEVLTNVNLIGSAVSKLRVGVTLKYHCATPGLQSVRAKRTSNTNIAANTSVSDETQWRDCLAVDPVTQAHFGNVTTVQTLTLPTPTALALKQRKLQLLVTRNIAIGTLSGGFVSFAPAGPSQFAGDILFAIATDPFIGNRPFNEVDTTEIYATLLAVQAYFGTTLVTNFDFTFDDKSVSFEESFADICTAAFCQGYRRASVLSLSFEQKTANSKGIFNHRNKLPGSETRTVTFGRPNDIDGIELTYNEPNDPAFPNQDTPKTITFPFTKYHVHCAGGTNVVRTFLNIGVSAAGVAYVMKARITVEGLAPITIFDDFGHSQTVQSGTTADVILNFTGDGVSSILFQVWSGTIGDELNFDGQYLYIAKVSDGINLIPITDLNFSGPDWSAIAGSVVTVTAVNSAAVNPKRITTVGIRNNVQAYLLGQRLYNKLIYQNTVTQFNATQEAGLSIINDRLLVADNTRQDTQDGEVSDSLALLLTLSQPVVFVAGRTYNIFLWHYDQTVESIGITAGVVPTNPHLFKDWDSTKLYRINDRVSFAGINYVAITTSTNLEPDTSGAAWQVASITTQVILAGAPSLPVVTDDNSFAKTGYIIVDNVQARSAAFLLSEKTPQDGMTYQVKAINYDDRYYFNDQDFIHGIVLSNGDSGQIGTAIAPGSTYRSSIATDLNPASGSSSTGHAGKVAGFFVPAVPPHNTPPFADGSPSDLENGDVIWSGFPAIRLSGATTLSIVVSALTAHTALILNGVPAALVGAATYTASIPAGTYLSTVTVEAKTTLANGGPASITITDISIT